MTRCLLPGLSRSPSPRPTARPWAPVVARRVALALGLLLGAVPAVAQTLRIGGTGSAIATMERLAEAFARQSPGFQLQVVPNLGSSGGIKALLDGAIQVGVVSRPLKAVERDAGLQTIPYGRSAFVVASSRTDVRNLSLDDLARLYSDERARWPDGSPVRIVLRPPTDADVELLAAFSPAVARAQSKAMERPGMVTALTDQDAALTLERLPGSLGATTMALLVAERRRVSTIAINGIEPTTANIASGRYPHTKTMSLVLRPDATPQARQFVDFVMSSAGRRLLVELGHVPPPAVAGPSHADAR